MLVEALLTICSLFIIRTDAIIGSTQNITVIGKVGCGYRAQSNVLIELREYDRFHQVPALRQSESKQKVQQNFACMNFPTNQAAFSINWATEKRTKVWTNDGTIYYV
ncbi:hypothetical protein Tcan_06972 [Toxocara canis]|uniref:Uncharacterized protein n=1 Tax=Toxocara canis TaxID=6265 RepID=A0A0B2W6E1_TOXCA|nr:hypothetical protein Tcan_06972 [Toxocara canis]